MFRQRVDFIRELELLFQTGMVCVQLEFELATHPLDVIQLNQQIFAFVGLELNFLI
jgi:hypothetical protein